LIGVVSDVGWDPGEGGECSESDVSTLLCGEIDGLEVLNESPDGGDWIPILFLEGQYESVVFVGVGSAVEESHSCFALRTEEDVWVKNMEITINIITMEFVNSGRAWLSGDINGV